MNTMSVRDLRSIDVARSIQIMGPVSVQGVLAGLGIIFCSGSGHHQWSEVCRGATRSRRPPRSARMVIWDDPPYPIVVI